MNIAALVLLLVFILVIGAWWVARLTARLQPRPCPPSFIFVLDNPFTAGYHRSILTRLELTPGLSVLDAGCGPGLLTIPIAKTVGPQGRVFAVDVQEPMLERAKQAAEKAGLNNITFLRAGLGEGTLPSAAFDRAVLVTVLGEIPDRAAALREIFTSLKPGGFLSITEVLPDPDYQPRSKVKSLARAVGFQIRNEYGNWFTFTVNLGKPG
jgi:ubiquinone/menaquinone biosynthesis C-methylase UbiE